MTSPLCLSYFLGVKQKGPTFLIPKQFICLIFEFMSECDKSDKSDKVLDTWIPVTCNPWKRPWTRVNVNHSGTRGEIQEHSTQPTGTQMLSPSDQPPGGARRGGEKDELRHRSSTWMILASPHRANHQPTNGVMNANERHHELEGPTSFVHRGLMLSETGQSHLNQAAGSPLGQCFSPYRHYTLPRKAQSPLLDHFYSHL